jgi:hypothetical protein
MKSHENIMFATQIYNFAKMMVSWDFMLVSWRFHRNNSVFFCDFFPSLLPQDSGCLDRQRHGGGDPDNVASRLVLGGGCCKKCGIFIW